MSKPEFTVSVQPQYLEDQSDPAQQRFAFAYTVTIRNSGDIPAQLIDAMRFHVASMYEGRGEQDVKQWTGVAEALARPYQIAWFGAC